MSSSTPHAEWSQRHQRISTAVGQWQPGRDARFRGHSLLHELLLELSYMQLKVYGITGRLVSAELGRWIEQAQFMTAYPDSRLWCNAIARFAAHTSSSPSAAVTAAYLAADSSAYGGYAMYQSAQALQACIALQQQGTPLPDIVQSLGKKGAGIAGFLRPVLRADERLIPLQQLTEKLGFSPAAHLQFGYELSDYLQAHQRGGMNAAGFIAAFLLDQQFSPDQIYLLSIGCVECGVLPCYEEQRGDLDDGFLPLACSDVQYRGPQRRTFNQTQL